VTHRYTLLVGGIVISGRDERDASAIAWAEGTVIALGSDEDVRAISRGDSHVVDLGGACVVPLGEASDATWQADATLEVGGRADLAVLGSDPRRPGDSARHRPVALALIRDGEVVAGMLPGGAAYGRSP